MMIRFFYKRRRNPLGEWYYGAKSNERFTPRGEREADAYTAGLRDAIRIMEHHRRCTACDKVTKAMKDVHKRALEFGG